MRSSPQVARFRPHYVVIVCKLRHPHGMWVSHLVTWCCSVNNEQLTQTVFRDNRFKPTLQTASLDQATLHLPVHWPIKLHHFPLLARTQDMGNIVGVL